MAKHLAYLLWQGGESGFEQEREACLWSNGSYHTRIYRLRYRVL